jgi:NADH dehydrogenase FAD-containing subunit
LSCPFQHKHTQTKRPPTSPTQTNHQQNSVTLIEAKELLGSFDGSLREYAARKLVRQGIQLRRGVVRSVEEGKLTLTDGTVIDYGLCIWSTGAGAGRGGGFVFARKTRGKAGSAKQKQPSQKQTPCLYY